MKCWQGGSSRDGGREDHLGMLEESSRNTDRNDCQWNAGRKDHQGMVAGRII